MDGECWTSRRELHLEEAGGLIGGPMTKDPCTERSQPEIMLRGEGDLGLAAVAPCSDPADLLVGVCLAMEILGVSAEDHRSDLWYQDVAGWTLTLIAKRDYREVHSWRPSVEQLVTVAEVINAAAGVPIATVEGDELVAMLWP